MEAVSKVLVVDDHDLTRRAIANLVRRHGYAVVECPSVEEAFRAFEAESFDIVLTDVKMEVLGGFDLLRGIRGRAPYVPVVLITGQASVGDMMNATDQGAFDYLAKPVDNASLGALLKRALEHRRLLLAEAAEPEVVPTTDFPNIIGKSRLMLAAFKRVALAARGEANVLITGESGTGKEMVAKALHDASARADKPFVAVNTGAINAGLAESELFGHRKGSFTDAHENRIGLFEQARGGTLFLDEIGDLPLGLQVKLLRAIQQRVIKPVGSNEQIEVDIRLVSATNRNLFRMMKLGDFREDLYYRINVVQISLPPLRERVDDIPQLSAFFLQKYSSKLGRRAPKLTEPALQVLMQHPWPGNVRELENVMQRLTDLDTDGVVTPDRLQLREHEAEMMPGTVPPTLPAGKSPDLGLIRSSESSLALQGRFLPLREKMQEYIDEVVEATGGNLSQAAKILEVSRRTLQRSSARRRQNA